MGDVKTDPYANQLFSGQVASGGSGTVTQLPDVRGTRGTLMAYPDNDFTAWVGFESGTLTALNGYPMTAFGAPLVLEGIENLDRLFVIFEDADDRLCWIMQRSLQEG